MLTRKTPSGLPVTLAPVSRWVMPLLIPVFIAFTGGIWVTTRISQVEIEQLHRSQEKEVTSQAKMVTESLLSQVESLRAQALSYQQARAAAGDQAMPFLAEGPVLHWAELEIRDGKVQRALRSARNPAWNGDTAVVAGSDQTYEDYYVHAVSQALNLTELKREGLSAVRVKQDPSSPTEWLAVAFPLPSPASNIVVMLLDPSRAFNVFQTWAGHSEAGALRSYLVAADGYVLAHSVKTYSGNDFSSVPVFRQAIGEMLAGKRASGTGTFVSADQQRVIASYQPLGKLPFGVVVERAVQGSSGSALRRAPVRVWAGLMLQLLAWLGVSILAAFAVAQVLRKRMDELLHPRPNPSEEEVDATVPMVPPSEEVSILGASPATDSIVRTPSSSLEIRTASEPRGSELVRSFESATQLLRDPDEIADRLTSVASRLYGCPSLFFAYYPQSHSAVLQAAGGLSHAELNGGLQFAINDQTFLKLLERGTQNGMMSLAQYGPLMRLLQSKMGHSRFEAWAAIGMGPKLLGVLVLLNPELTATANADDFSLLMQTTSIRYEKALFSQ